MDEETESKPATIDVDDILKRHKEAINKAALEAVMINVKRQFEWELPETVKAEIDKFMAEEIAPEVVKKLKGEKSAILVGVTKAVNEISEKYAASMVERAVTNINGYKGRDLIQQLLD